MKALYQNDTDKGAGYGIFRLEQVSTSDAAARYALMRSSDQKSLHPGGWEDTECTLAPDSVMLKADGLCLCVGPDVVARLDQLNTYRLVYLPSSGPAEKAVLNLGHIIYAPTGGANVVGAPVVKAAPVPVPVPVAEPEPVSEPAPELPPQTAKKGVPGGKFALPILIILGMAFGAYLALKDKMAAEQAAPEQPVVEQAAPEQAAEAKTEEPSPPAEDPVPAEKPAPPTAQQAVIPPLDQARQFLRSGGSADEAMSLALRLPESPEGRDATFLLAETAAEQGHAGAMLELAEFYDPQSQKPRGSILADAEQAWIWYGKAEQAGRAEAADRRAALRSWLESEASKGSAEAADVLRRLQ